MKRFSWIEMEGPYARLFVEGVFVITFLISAEAEMIANNINLQLAARWGKAEGRAGEKKRKKNAAPLTAQR